jgi:hypothetical protein
MMARGIELAAHEIRTIEKRPLTPKALQNDEFIIDVTPGQRLNQLQGIPADTCLPIVSQPRIDANSHRQRPPFV